VPKNRYAVPGIGVECVDEQHRRAVRMPQPRGPKRRRSIIPCLSNLGHVLNIRDRIGGKSGLPKKLTPAVRSGYAALSRLHFCRRSRARDFFTDIGLGGAAVLALAAACVGHDDIGRPLKARDAGPSFSMTPAPHAPAPPERKGEGADSCQLIGMADTSRATFTRDLPVLGSASSYLFDGKHLIGLMQYSRLNFH
jgi:hypothetical protein